MDDVLSSSAGSDLRTTDLISNLRVKPWKKAAVISKRSTQCNHADNRLI